MTTKKALPQKGKILICERNRFTEFIASENSASFASLYNWLAWFRSRGIEAVLHHSRTKGFAVYREGLIREE